MSSKSSRSTLRVQIRRLCNLLAERKMSMENEISKLQAKNLRLHRIVRRLAHMLQDEDRAKAHMPGRPSCIYHDAEWFIALAERLVDQMHGEEEQC